MPKYSCVYSLEVEIMVDIPEIDIDEAEQVARLQLNTILESTRLNVLSFEPEYIEEELL